MIDLSDIQLADFVYSRELNSPTGRITFKILKDRRGGPRTVNLRELAIILREYADSYEGWANSEDKEIADAKQAEAERQQHENNKELSYSKKFPFNNKG